MFHQLIQYDLVLLVEILMIDEVIIVNEQVTMT